MILGLVEGDNLVLLVLIEAQMATAARILSLLRAAKKKATVLCPFIIEKENSSRQAARVRVFLASKEQARCFCHAGDCHAQRPVRFAHVDPLNIDLVKSRHLALNLSLSPSNEAKEYADCSQPHED